MHNSNIPKAFLRYVLSSLFDNIPPNIAPIIPNITIDRANLYFTFLFFELTITEHSDDGTKNNKFVACAICCSIPKKLESDDIKNTPPPIPHEAIIPDITPNIISIAYLNMQYDEYNKNIINTILKTFESVFILFNNLLPM